MRLSFYPVTAQNAFIHVTSLPPPRIPWQVTGNHWLALPCIHPADGAIHALGIIHRGARAAIEIAGGPAFIDGGETPLFPLTIGIGCKMVTLAAHGVASQPVVGLI